MATSVHDIIGRETARAELAAAKAVGIIVGFKHRQELAVPIACERMQEDTEDHDLPMGRRVGHDSMKLVVPTQQPAWSGASGFSGTWGVWPVASGASHVPEQGDRVEYPIGSARYFYLQGQIDVLDNGYSYVIVATQARTLALGEKEAGS